jgi:hypothetical protein
MAPKKVVLKQTPVRKTDAEKKKIKQANKAAANPGKAEEKKVKNLERQYGRGQLKRPTELGVVENVDEEGECFKEVKKEKTATASGSERSRIMALKLASFRKNDPPPSNTATAAATATATDNDIRE